MTGLQEMLLSPEPGPQGKLNLFPGWPQEWDVDFKLHAPGQTVVEGVLQGGKLVSLKVTPNARAKDSETAGSNMKQAEKSLQTGSGAEEQASLRYRIPSIERVFEFLETLAKHPGGMTFMELVDTLRIPKSGAFRMLTTLMYLQYLTKDEVTGKITLTRKILALGNTTICQYNLHDFPAPVGNDHHGSRRVS